MSTALLCRDCGEKRRRSTIAEEPGMSALFVYGTVVLDKPGDTIVRDFEGKEIERMTHDCCLCDSCSTPLPVGALACAWTCWNVQRGDPKPWWMQYLAEINDVHRTDW